MNYVLTENAVRKIKRAITPRLGDGLAPTGGPATISPDTYPAPFTVRWAASLAEPESSEGAGDATEGEWIIYLPTTGLLKVGAADVNITSALTAAGGIYPAGWYKLLDSNADPILSRTTGGTLYLNINATDTPTAAFSATAGSSGGDNPPIVVKIATAAVDSTSGARTVNQFVSSALVVGAGKASKTTADEISISRMYDGSSVMLESNIVQIKGFGRFHPDSVQHPTDVRGTYEAPTTLDIVPGEETSVAMLARVGNSPNTDANSLGYRKLRVKNLVAPAPFDVELVDNVKTIVRCNFYFGGTLRTLSDYAAPSSGTLYLAFTRSDPDPERGEPAVWSYQLTTTPAEPTTGASTVMNVKLYDFAAGEVTVDYRSAFLTVPAPDFDLYYGKYEFHNLKLGGGSGEPTTLGKIVATQDATISQKQIAAGDNITVREANGVITISSTGGGGSTSGYSTASGQYRYTVRDMRYDTVSCQLQIKYNRETWENGIMKTSEELAWQMMEGGQAVEETV